MQQIWMFKELAELLYLPRPHQIDTPGGVYYEARLVG